MSSQNWKPACNGQGQPPAPGEDVLGTQVDAACHQNACADGGVTITQVLTDSLQPLQPIPLLVWGEFCKDIVRLTDGDE